MLCFRIIVVTVRDIICKVVYISDTLMLQVDILCNVYTTVHKYTTQYDERTTTYCVLSIGVH